jgi:putative ABC transport system permease protein
MVYLRLGIREFRQRPGRSILTLLSIVIGVAAVVAVNLAAGTTRQAFDDIFRTVAGRADLEVTVPFGTTFDERLAGTLREIRGVATVSPVVERYAVMFLPDKRVQFTVMGVDPQMDRHVHDYTIVAGKPLGDGPGVILDSTFANNLGIKLGDRVDLQTKIGIKTAYISGLFRREGTSTTGHGVVMLMSLNSAQTLFKARRQLDNAQIVLDKQADEGTVRAAIAKVLPRNVTVGRPAARSAMAEETSLSTQQGMEMARGFSLTIAVFIIANTFLINITQRRKQIGILRAIGTTRMQIGIMIYSEAILMGIIGSILGCIAGVAAAHVLTRAMGNLYETTLPPVVLTWQPFAVAGLIGVGISLLGAALPARRARQLSPMDALRDVLPGEIEGFTRWMAGVGTLFIVLGGIVLVASVTGRIESMNAVKAAIFLLIGLMLLLPLALRPLSALAAAPLLLLMKIESRLARRQILRNYSRSTLTIIVVFVAISTGIGLANSVLDNVNDVRNWYRTAIVADFVVRAMAPDMATGLAANLPDGIGAKLREIPGINSIEGVRLVRTKVGDEQIVMAARDFSPHTIETFAYVAGDPKKLLSEVTDGGVVVGSVLAQRAKLSLGDRVTVGAGDATESFPIVAIVNDYQAGGLILYIERSVARKELNITGVDAYTLMVDHKQMNEVRSALEKLASDNGLLLESSSEIQHKIDGMISGVVGALWGMVALLLLVAAFGVANTLTMNVLEQTRELGLLRIIAMTRDQVRKTIFAQALMIGLLALVPGILAGFAIAYLINLATLPVIGHPVRLEFHPVLMFGAFALGLIVVAAAAWFPAERAARLQLAEALHYD